MKRKMKKKISRWLTFKWMKLKKVPQEERLDIIHHRL